MKITYLFPSRSRPEKFFTALDNIKNLSENDNYEILAILDLDDYSMNNNVVKMFIHKNTKITPIYGNSISKVNAINRGVGYIGNDTDIVCLQSDDFVFLNKGFDTDIRNAFANGFRGLVHFPDGRVNERLITYPIMHISYLCRFRYIYHPDYLSVYCDEEQQDVAKLLGMYKYMDKHIMQHRHYRAGFGKPDALMLHNDSKEMYQHDSEVYYRRKAMNFGLNSVTA